MSAAGFAERRLREAGSASGAKAVALRAWGKACLRRSRVKKGKNVVGWRVVIWKESLVPD
jgi:hypothetical protein